MLERIGKFSLQQKDVILNKDNLVAEIFKQLSFIPYKAEHRSYEGKFVYHGVSHMFEEIEFGMSAVEYHINVETCIDGPEGMKYKISVARV